LGNQQLNLGIRNTFSSPDGGYTVGIDGTFFPNKNAAI
jgi:hypothetical protein